MSEQTDEYDVLVIGGGPAGENAADYAVRGSGRTAAVMERELMGGECSYWACMPSKALLRPLDVVAAANHLPGVSGPVEIDREALLARRDSWTSGWDDAGQVTWAEGAGLDVVRGHGRLAGERTVEVTAADGSTRTLHAREAVVLATGSVAVVPDSFAGANPWTSRDATAVSEVPGSLAIVGGGVVACEAARWLAALGSRVTMLVRDDRLLGRSEPFASDLVAEGLRGAGVEVRLGAEVGAVRRADVRDVPVGRLHGGPVTLEVDGVESTYDEVLVATGRRPATDDLGLDSVGLGVDDLHGRTYGGPLPAWLYVVGDLDGEAPLTHWGKYQARLVGDRIAGRAVEVPEDVPVPQVVFTDPQVAWVGVTSDKAPTGSRTVDASYGAVAGAALLRDDVSGQARLVLAEDGTLIGATFVGAEVAELLHSATVAIVGRMTLKQLRHAIASYPTAAEIWLNLVEE